MSLNLELLDMVEIAVGVAQETEGPAKSEDKEIRMDISADIPRVSGDRSLLYRTLTNLMINAVKHTGRGGVITVSVAGKGDNLEVKVEDTGYGIPADYLETIFEKFAQVETKQRSGSGLGLTFCKMAVEAHGGRIWAESEEGKGSTFTFLLPLASGATA